MSLVIQNNISMINTQNKYKVNTGNKAKSTEKLSSGYRINRAADDAAGLQISEKMRWQIRGLDQGTRNGQDGVSWVQIGDGALGEVQAMLHRMKELTVQSLNDTNTPADRAALQAEFDALQCEIDRISDTTQFNTKDIFNEHEPTYYQFEGNVHWDQGQTHVITAGKNELTVEYQKDAASPVETVTLTVPAGEYTTQELTDELEDAIKAAAPDSGLVVEFTKDGTFNVNLEGGEKINDVKGDLAYLLYDTYKGGSVGALIGTTYFANDEVKLLISSENNQLSFDIETFDGQKSNVNITLPEGRYNRPQIIEMLNNQLSGTPVKATSYGTGIKLGSNDAIITGFKGNMFKIDEGTRVYSSVFYDNVKYGNIYMTSGSFKGGAVIPEKAEDLEHQFFTIDSSNNQLTFLANGSTTPVTITIPENTTGSSKNEYTLAEMVTTLNKLFADNGLDLTASSYDGGSYKGLEIKSNIKGVKSQVGLDTTSSAYETLFVKRVYNVYRTDADSDRETRADQDAYVKGSKTFRGNNIPFTVVAGQNDKFVIDIDGSKYTITLDATDYADATELADEINEKLNGSAALAGYKGIVTAEAVNDVIKLTATPDKNVVDISVEAATGNTGYDDIFVGKIEMVNKSQASGTGTASSPATVTLNTSTPEPVTIAPGDNMLVIELDGVKREVTLPTGDVSHADIIQAIENTVTAGDKTVFYSFEDIYAQGTDKDNHFNGLDVAGKTNSPYKSYSDAGDAKSLQGTAGGYEYNEPAKVTMSVSVPDTMTLNSSNNKIYITLNNDNRTIELDTKTYTRSELVAEIQKKIDSEYGVNEQGAKVYLNGANQLVFESRLNYADGTLADGRDTNISFNTNSSSFIKELHTTRDAGYVDTAAMLGSIYINDDNREFSFEYTENGVSKTITAQLDKGSYSQPAFAKMLTKAIKNAGAAVTASVVDGKLRLTTDAVGAGNSVDYSSKTGGSSVDAIFGKRTTGTPATALAEASVQNTITIGSGNKGFDIKVNGVDCHVDLDENTYTTRKQFVDMLDAKLDAIGVDATLEGDRIRYTTQAVGSTASIEMTYGTGGSSMAAIYGSDTQTLSGIKAAFDGNNKLVLTRTENGGTINVHSDYGSVFQEPEITYTDIELGKQQGYTSAKKSYVDGVNITEPVTINKWNNDLNFVYYEDGSTHNVSLTLAEKDYTYAELVTALQSEIDAQVGGAGKILVTASDSGVRLEVQTPGSKHYINENNFSGDFYHKVMCSTYETSMNTSVKVSNGTAPKDTAFTVGRKDVKNNVVEIKTGVNDTLSLDFTYNNTELELTMTLDAGNYKGQSLVNMIQQKLDEQLIANGLEAGTIEVGVGGISTGVVGSNDANALNFQLSKSVTLPEEGTYIIDGVSGNAAFSVFYQTDGELIPAYVKGPKDISEGVTIDSTNNTLTFDVDGTGYSLTLTEGEYTAQEIIDEINVQITAAGAPVAAELDGKNLKISYNKLGEHEITNVGGSAKQDLFFQENGEIGEEKNINIQLSSNVGDYLEIDKANLSTAFLKINSVAITRPKYANKALDRIDSALNMVSDIRSTFGAEQNRLEYAINSNRNKSENTQAAESRIRDVDMAKEMVEYSKHSILQNAAQAMMVQANSSAGNVVQLLQM